MGWFAICYERVRAGISDFAERAEPAVVEITGLLAGSTRVEKPVLRGGLETRPTKDPTKNRTKNFEKNFEKNMLANGREHATSPHGPIECNLPMPPMKR